MPAASTIDQLDYTVGRKTELKDLRVITALPIKLTKDRAYHVEVKNQNEIHISSVSGIEDFSLVSPNSNISLTKAGVSIKHDKKTIFLHREARKDFIDVILPEEVGIADELSKLAASNDPAEKRKILANIKLQILKEGRETVRASEPSYSPSSESRGSVYRSGG